MARLRTIRTFALGLSCSLALNVANGQGFLGDLSPTTKKAPAAQAGDADEPLTIGEIDSATPAGTASVPEIVHERYPNRAIKTERQMVLDSKQNFVNHGFWKMWTPQGELLGEGKYKFGKRDGAWIRHYYESEVAQSAKNTEKQKVPFSGPSYKSFTKPFQSVAHFNDGKLAGAWTITDAQGRPISSWEFDGDTLHGTATWYYHSGAKRREVHFDHGILNGEWNEWNENNEVVAKEIYIEGRKLEKIIDTYEGGEKRLEGYQLLASEQMAFSHNWWNGTVNFELVNVTGEDQKHGLWTMWASNGGKIYQGSFDRGMAVGRHTEWHSNGQKESDGVYIKGKRDGRWAWWHENGIKNIQGQFAAGNEVGTWLTWEASGKLESKQLRTAQQTVQVSATQEQKIESVEPNTTTVDPSELDEYFIPQPSANRVSKAKPQTMIKKKNTSSSKPATSEKQSETKKKPSTASRLFQFLR